MNNRSIASLVVGLIAGVAMGVSEVEAAPIGQVGTPGSHSTTVGAVTYTVSDFVLLNSVANGGPVAYQAGDIDIDLATGGGSTVLLSFSKHLSTPTPGVVFFVNPGESRGFTFSYTLAIAPAVAGSGTVSFVDMTNSFNESHTNNALASVQTIVSPTNSVVSTTDTSDTKSLAGQPNTISVGDIATLTGNTGNTSILTFSSLFQTSFTPVPEPSAIALIGVAAVIGSARRRRSLAKQ